MKDHFYKNHQEICDVLTKKYGFEFTGVGDNSEESFRKDSERPETIWIHPMHITYYRNSSRGWEGYKNRTDHFYQKTDLRNEEDQKKAFENLCKHLDGCTQKPRVDLTKESITTILKLMDQKRLELIDMALDHDFNIESKKKIPAIYENLIEYQSTLSYVLSCMK